jgi:hypothetical protein
MASQKFRQDPIGATAIVHAHDEFRAGRLIDRTRHFRVDLARDFLLQVLGPEGVNRPTLFRKDDKSSYVGPLVEGPAPENIDRSGCFTAGVMRPPPHDVPADQTVTDQFVIQVGLSLGHLWHFRHAAPLGSHRAISVKRVKADRTLHRFCGLVQDSVAGRVPAGFFSCGLLLRPSANIAPSSATPCLKPFKPVFGAFLQQVDTRVEVTGCHRKGRHL